MSESNRPRQVGGLEPLPLGQWHIHLVKAEGARVEIAMPFQKARSASNGVPSPIGLPFYLIKLRQQESNLRLSD